MNRELVVSGIVSGLLVGAALAFVATRGLGNPFRRERTAAEKARRWAKDVGKDWAEAAAPVRDGAMRMGGRVRRSGRDLIDAVT